MQSDLEKLIGTPEERSLALKEMCAKHVERLDASVPPGAGKEKERGRELSHTEILKMALCLAGFNTAWANHLNEFLEWLMRVVLSPGEAEILSVEEVQTCLSPISKRKTADNLLRFLTENDFFEADNSKLSPTSRFKRNKGETRDRMLEQAILGEDGLWSWLKSDPENLEKLWEAIMPGKPLPMKTATDADKRAALVRWIKAPGMLKATAEGLADEWRDVDGLRKRRKLPMGETNNMSAELQAWLTKNGPKIIPKGLGYKAAFTYLADKVGVPRMAKSTMQRYKMIPVSQKNKQSKFQ